MGFYVAEYTARLCGPHKYRAVVTACDEPTSIGTDYHGIYDTFVCQFSIAFLVFELVGHDRLEVKHKKSTRKMPPFNPRVTEQRKHPHGQQYRESTIRVHWNSTSTLEVTTVQRRAWRPRAKHGNIEHLS